MCSGVFFVPLAAIIPVMGGNPQPARGGSKSSESSSLEFCFHDPLFSIWLQMKGSKYLEGWPDPGHRSINRVRLPFSTWHENAQPSLPGLSSVCIRSQVRSPGLSFHSLDSRWDCLYIFPEKKINRGGHGAGISYLFSFPILDNQCHFHNLEASV